MGYRMAEGVRWDDFDETMAAVRDVGPGGHYLGHPHTQANFQRAFFMPSTTTLSSSGRRKAAWKSLSARYNSKAASR